jgi:DNA replication protein DnaC
VALDELGYLAFAHSGGQSLFHLVSKLCEETSVVITTNLAFRNVRGLPFARVIGLTFRHLGSRYREVRIRP